MVPDVDVNDIRDTAEEVSAMITVAWAVQEELFIVPNPSLTKAHRNSTSKVMFKFMFAKVAEG